MSSARLLEGVFFLTLAGGMHLAALSLIEAQGTAGGSGSQGQAEISLTASPEIKALIEEWQRPPETAQAVPMPPSTPPSMTQMTAPAPPQPVNAPPRTLTQALAPASMSDHLPQADIRLPALRDVSGTAPQTLSVPEMTQSPVLETVQQDKAALPSAPPLMQMTRMDKPPVPDVTSPLAPGHSKRPKARPDNLRPTPIARPSAPQVARRASGHSGGQVAGSGSAPSATSGADTAQIASDRAKWQARIKRAAQRAHRPARGTRARGKVLIRLSISAKGRLLDASILRSSGHAALDRAALQNLRRARYPGAPQSLGGKSWTDTITVEFR